MRYVLKKCSKFNEARLNDTVYISSVRQTKGDGVIISTERKKDI